MTRSAVPPPVTAVMEAADDWLPARLAEVERRLESIASGHGPELGTEAEATLTAGGKRLRPLLVLICAGATAGPRAVRAAVAVELVHMATLVHDDVLDGAPVRRGRPTVFARAGREAAVGVGDLLFSRALAELAEPAAESGEIAELSSASVALARGELAQRRDAFDTSVGEERYLRRCALKTARLFEAACRVGRLSSEQPGSEELAGFGREIGLSFQLLDDVLDVTGPPERTGKARGTDLLDGTVTLPLILAMRRDPGLGELDLRGLDSADAERVCDRIAATGALDEVRARARAGIERAKEVLAHNSFTPPERRLLGLIADGLVERYS
jgi:geranylgeranyl pyrophosphate synthase